MKVGSFLLKFILKVCPLLFCCLWVQSSPVAAILNVSIFEKMLACFRRSDSGARAKKKASRAGKNEERLGKRTRERL